MARTIACVVKDLVLDTSWLLEMSSTREIGSKPLQRWRRLVTGDGNEMSRREQIAECLNLLSSNDVDDESLPASPIEFGHLGKDDLESNLEGISDGGRLTIMRTDDGDKFPGSERSDPDVEDSFQAPAAGNISVAPERSSHSPSNGSEFRNADSFISEAEYNTSEDDVCLDSSDTKFLGNDDERVLEAYHFNIFHCDDLENREPVSVFNLAFDDEESKEHGVKLILIASPSKKGEAIKYMGTIDSWTMRVDKKSQLSLYARDVQGKRYKLCTPDKRYRAVFNDCHIVVSFLDSAMKLGSKFRKPNTYYTEIQKLVRVDKSKIRDVLKKYYNSVVQKFVLKGGIPLLRDAQIIRNMKDALKVSSEIPIVRLSKINESEDKKEIASPKKIVSKRKRVVVSDSEDEVDVCTDPENMKQRPQRNKRKNKVRRSESMLVSEDAMKICSGHKQDLNNSKGWRSDKMLDVAEVGVPEVLKDHLDVAEKSAETTVGIVEPATENVEVSRNNFHGGEYGDVEMQTTGIYDGQEDMPEDFGSDEFGDAAFCAICDDGGDLLFCDGPCGRSFHASKAEAAASSESKCRSLGFKAEEVKEMGSWLCPNCEYKRHQCFICGNLGNSEGDFKEVFLCDVALCGRFYHPLCLGEFTNMSKREIGGFVNRIKDGTDSVFCPAHKCLKCLEGETDGRTDNSMKLAKCRRCPKAYHKICLPVSISFEGTDYEPIRAWEIGDDDDPVKRLVIYCTDHIIDEDLNTPKRDHLRWPEEYLRKDGRKMASLSAAYESNMYNRARKRGVATRDFDGEEPSGKPSPIVRPKGIEKTVDSKKIVSKLSPIARTDEPFASRREQHFCSHTAQVVKPRSVADNTTPLVALQMPICREALLTRVKELQEMSASMVTVESVHKSLFHPSCYVANSRKNFIRRGDLVSIINAAKKAVEKIEGGNTEDAKSICPRGYFQLLARSEDALKVYLAPLLHGTRYTSYGRHFTNPDKLKEIVERIHWYIDDGDMIVDFCCGANDFSTLLKEKLDGVGKKCDYKNFDIHPPKNTFAFAKGDWFENKGEGFSEGKKLVMGLNPPFGSKAALATKFVLHALTFRPKLLVLIVPPETMDGGRKYAEFNYSLVWEDKDLLSGKSFYLPGSLNKSDEGNLAQWNNVAPPLFLWCPAEMLGKNQDIAVQQKHIRSLPAGVPDLHSVPLRDEPSQMLAVNHRNSMLHVDIHEGRMQRTPIPSPTGPGDFDLRPSSGALPSRSKSPLSDDGLTVPLSRASQKCSSPEEVSTRISTPLSTTQSSSGSQDGQIPGNVADPHQLGSSKKKKHFDGPGRVGGFAGHYVPLPKIAPETSSGSGHSELNRNRMLRGVHGEEYSTPHGLRPESSREGIEHAGVMIDHSGSVPTTVGLSPATFTNLRRHGNLPGSRGPPFRMTQQGRTSHLHIPSTSSSHPGMPQNPLPPPPPLPHSPAFPSVMQHTLGHRNMPRGTGQSHWAFGGLPPPLPFHAGLAQSIHAARNQLPVHEHGHGLLARPPVYSLIPGSAGHPGVLEFVPPFVNGGYPWGRVGEYSFGRVCPSTLGGMHMGGPVSFGSGGWIEPED